MAQIRLWVYDGIMASSAAGCIDVFTLANAVWAEKNGGGKMPPLRWRVESLDGKPVRTASGQIASVDGPINARAATDAVIVAAPFVANLEGFLASTELLNPLFAAPAPA